MEQEIRPVTPNRLDPPVQILVLGLIKQNNDQRSCFSIQDERKTAQTKEQGIAYNEFL